MNRNGLIDIYRFFASLCIVADHVVALGIRDFPCAERGYHVIFFFMLTGYFTKNHFEKKDDNIISYTFYKFSKFLPYTFVSVILGNIILLGAEGSLGGVVYRAFFSVFEILMLGEIPLVGYSNVVPPLWTLSSMLICFPIACVLIKTMKNNRLVFWGVLYATIIGLNAWKNIANYQFPIKTLLTLACILSGSYIYDGVKKIKGILEYKIITILGVIAFIGTILICYFVVDQMDAFIVLSVAAVTLTTSGAELFKGNALTDFLGNISMVIYIIHYNGVRIVNVYFKEMSNNVKVIVYFVLVIILSVLVYVILEIMKRKGLFDGIKNKIKAKVNNKEL